MNITDKQPAIKANGQRLNESIVIGKDILELVSASMYVDPLTIFREYVQNAADSIDEATEIGAYKGKVKPKIEITLDAATRRILICDNGLGVRSDKLTRTMTAFGASKKRGTNARGFRGVGRLSGLAYCKELVFRTRQAGESKTSEIRWNGERLKTLLRDHTYTGSLDDIVREIVTVHHNDDQDYPSHFFEVELHEPVRIKNDLLLNEEAIHQYLSQVGPVPFSPDFSFGQEITRHLQGFSTGGVYDIHLNGEPTPIYRPFRDSFDARLGVVDSFAKVEFIQISGATEEFDAVGWVLHHGFQGALPSGLGVKGIRLRKGNIQVGSDSLLDEIFDEPRFNSWSVAEFHALSKNLVPNGRRDCFDQNRTYQDLLSKLMPVAKTLSKLCRSKSQERHKAIKSKPAGTITTKQETLLKKFPSNRQKAFRQVLEALYELKGADAEGLVTEVLRRLSAWK